MVLKSFIHSIKRIICQKEAGKSSSNSKSQRKISDGFQIEKPYLFIPWNIDKNDLKKLFENYELKRITSCYFTAKCHSLRGLKCIIGFHFSSNGLLEELEFFRKDYSNQEESFNDFQSKFEIAFGKPTNTTKGNEGYHNYVWSIDDIQISHFIYDRFGLEEHMRIKKIR